MSATMAKPWRPTEGLRNALTVLLPIAAVLSTVQVAAFAHRRSVFKDSAATLDDLKRTDHLVGGIGISFLVVAAIAAILLMIWMFRSAKNVDALGRTGGMGPGWAIGGWFIPIANFFIPFRVLNELHRGSAPERTVGTQWKSESGSKTVIGWAAGWVIAAIARIALPNVKIGDTSAALLDKLDRQVSTSAVAALFTVIAAVFAVATIRTITARQAAALLNAEQYAQAAPPPPPGYAPQPSHFSSAPSFAPPTLPAPASSGAPPPPASFN